MLARKRIEVFPGTLTFWLNVILVVGITLRLRQFLFGRSMWADEAYYAASSGDRTLIELLTIPLDRNQSAPPLYTLIAKSSIAIFGEFDWSLRLPSLLFSIAMILFAKWISQRFFVTSISAIFFMALMAIAPIFLFYTAEFKPYIVDACAATALFWALVVRDSRHGTVILAVVGAVALLASSPFVFLAGPAAVLVTWECLATRGRPPRA